MASGQEKRSGTMSTMEAQSDDPRFKRRIPASFYENEQAQFEKLPHGWEVAEKGNRKYFVDHKNKVTTWVDPRTKPLRKQDVSAVQMGELPYGWEEAVDPDFGVYYINHLVQSNYVDPPWDPVVRDQVSQLQQYLTQQIEKEKRTLEEREKVEHSKLDEAAKKVEQLEREKLALERDLAFLQQKAMASDTESDATSVLSEKMAKIDDELEAMRKQDIPKSRMEFEQRLMELVALNNTLANQGPGFDEVKHYQKTEAEIREVNAQLEREASLRYELEKQIMDLKRQMEETHGFSASPRLGDGSSPDLYYSSPPTQYMDEPRMHAGGMTRKTRFEMEAELLMLKKRLQAEKSEKARLTNLKDEMELENSKGKMPNWIREINNVAASSKTLRVKIGKQQVKNPDVLTFRERMLFFAAGSVDPNIAAKRH